jgi:hypothetical protein
MTTHRIASLAISLSLLVTALARASGRTTVSPNVPTLDRISMGADGARAVR